MFGRYHKKILICCSVSFISFYKNLSRCDENILVDKINFSSWGIHRKKVKTKVRHPCSSFDSLSVTNKVDSVVDDSRLFIRFSESRSWEEFNVNGLDVAYSSCGDGDIYFATKGGEVYKVNKEKKMEKIEVPCEVREILVKNGRTCLIDVYGNVYFKGENNFGECGLGTEVQIAEFTKIPEKFFDSPVVQVSLGKRHTLFRTQTGRIFSCGANDYMQLGVMWTKEKCWLANQDWLELAHEGAEKTIKLLQKIKSRRAFYGTKTFEFYPRVLLGSIFEGNCVLVSAGNKHSAALIQSGLRGPCRVVTWGCSEQGQCGHRNIANMVQPDVVQSLEQFEEYDENEKYTVSLEPRQVVCGNDHTLFLISGPTTNMVFGVGSNARNQISSAKKKTYTQPHLIKKLTPQL